MKIVSGTRRLLLLRLRAHGLFNLLDLFLHLGAVLGVGRGMKIVPKILLRSRVLLFFRQRHAQSEIQFREMMSRVVRKSFPRALFGFVELVQVKVRESIDEPSFGEVYGVKAQGAIGVIGRL